MFFDGSGEIDLQSGCSCPTENDVIVKYANSFNQDCIFFTFNGSFRQLWRVVSGGDELSNQAAMLLQYTKAFRLYFLLMVINSGVVDAQTANAGFSVAAEISPRIPASKTVTNFSQALRCMDELFLAHGKEGFVITSSGMPDETGKVRTGTKEMLITAIAAMALKSHAFEFIDFHGGGDDLARMFEARGGGNFKIPDFYIRGAITQMDDNVIRTSRDGGLSSSSDSNKELLDPLNVVASGAKNEAFDLLGMDMSIAASATRRIIPVTATTNTMLMARAGKSGDSGGKVGKVGLNFNLDRSASEGVGSATRALLELSLIETLGKFTQVPYWRCLDHNITHPLIREQAKELYDSLSDNERTLFVQRKLGGSLNRYKGPMDGLYSQELKQAVAEYQVSVGLIADGKINFNLYASLLDDIQNSLAAIPVNDQITVKLGFAK